MPSPVIVVDYDPRWPHLFEAEKALLRHTLGDRITAIEHVGSTAVPGLGAKPVIDIMAAVPRLALAAECVPLLASINYEYFPEYEKKIPERRFFRKGPADARTHHLHIAENTSDFWRWLVAFRDYLRAHPDIAREYERTKRAFAAQYGPNRDGYQDAKGPFIVGVVENL
ncbi:MAG: GrpB family protein [bacterium]